jgi:hypothetical protein
VITFDTVARGERDEDAANGAAGTRIGCRTTLALVKRRKIVLAVHQESIRGLWIR